MNKKYQRNFQSDNTTLQRIEKMQWYFKDKSELIRVAIYLLYLLFTNRIEINWKNEKPISW